MAFPSGIFELAWIALFCFGFIFVTCFRLYWKRILVSLGTLRTNRIAWRVQNRKSSQNSKSSSSSSSSPPPSSISTQTSQGTTQSQNNISNNQVGTTTNWNVRFGYSYLDYQCLLQPPNLHGISPQVVPHYVNHVNHMSYFCLRPQLSVVQEDSREQEAEMESTGSLENESDRRSCDQIQATYSANDHRPSVSDLNLDSNFEMILLSPSTPPPPYSDKNIIAFV